jgi:hypothetical protein
MFQPLAPKHDVVPLLKILIERFLFEIGRVDPASFQFFAFHVAIIKIHMSFVGM